MGFHSTGNGEIRDSSWVRLPKCGGGRRRWGCTGGGTPPGCTELCSDPRMLSRIPRSAGSHCQLLGLSPHRVHWQQPCHPHGHILQPRTAQGKLSILQSKASEKPCSHNIPSPSRHKLSISCHSPAVALPSGGDTPQDTVLCALDLSAQGKDGAGDGGVSKHPSRMFCSSCTSCIELRTEIPANPIPCTHRTHPTLLFPSVLREHFHGTDE